MSNVFYTILIILLIIWAVGFFSYNMGGLIHILIVLVVLGLLVRLIRGRF